MDGKKGKFDNHVRQGERCPANLLPALEFVKQIPDRLHNSLKSHFKHLAKNEVKIGAANPLTMMGRQSFNAFEVNLDKQLQAWKENPNWVGQPPEITVSVPKGSLCNLKVKFNVGLPPDAIYNIVIDPDNKRVFKNIQVIDSVKDGLNFIQKDGTVLNFFWYMMILVRLTLVLCCHVFSPHKEVISRKVLIDEGQRQLVEVEQAALWKFLWWSGTISVHVFVDQNRKDHSVKFKQGKTGFMNKFEGCWKVEPLLVDSCTGSKGRIGSIVTLDQLIEPALVPPPPISWYLRGITTRTTEMLITDLLAEAARLRGDLSSKVLEESLDPACVGRSTYIFDDGIKERWQQRRSLRRQRTHRALV